MSKSVIVEGKTTQEALERGLKELKARKDDVEIKVLDENKRSFYSILSPRVVKLEVTLKENVETKKQVEEKHEKAPRKYNENNDNRNTEYQRENQIGIADGKDVGRTEK